MNKALIILATILAMGIGTTAAAAANAGKSHVNPHSSRHVKHASHTKHVKNHVAKSHTSAKVQHSAKPTQKHQKLSAKSHTKAQKHGTRLERRHW